MRAKVVGLNVGSLPGLRQNDRVFNSLDTCLGGHHFRQHALAQGGGLPALFGAGSQDAERFAHRIRPVLNDGQQQATCRIRGAGPAPNPAASRRGSRKPPLTRLASARFRRASGSAGTCTLLVAGSASPSTIAAALAGAFNDVQCHAGHEADYTAIPYPGMAYRKIGRQKPRPLRSWPTPQCDACPKPASAGRTARSSRSPRCPSHRDRHGLWP